MQKVAATRFRAAEANACFDAPVSLTESARVFPGFAAIRSTDRPRHGPFEAAISHALSGSCEPLDQTWEVAYVSIVQPKRLLFVCVENANRSQMAQAFARIHGGDQVDAVSAGSRPSGVLNPRAVRFMAEIGYDLTSHRSTSLDQVRGEFDAVITMGCGDSCPWVPARHRLDWQLPDPKEMDDENYRRIRDEISRRVVQLLAELQCS